MKTVLHIFLYLVIVLILLVSGFIGFIQFRGIPKDEVDKIDFAQVQSDTDLVANGQKIASVQIGRAHV